MSKEITLEELANSSRTNQQVQQPRRTTVAPESPSHGAVKMSPSQVADTLTRAGVMQEKKEKIVEAPLVDNAFKSMDRTLKERKEWIQNTMMPIVEENARELALENELGPQEEGNGESVSTNQTVMDVEEDYSDDSHTSNTTDTDDLFSELDEEDDTATDQSPVEVKVEDRHYSFEKVNVPEATESATIAKTKAETKAKASDESDDESGSLDDLMKDLEKEDSMNVVDDEDETPEEIREKFKETLKDVKITSDPIDFNQFKIRKQAVNSNLILKTLKGSRVVKKADWALYYSKRAITFLECSGPELDTLRKNIANANGVNGVITSLRFIYDHIEDANKPSFEQWTKLIRTEDIESLYYGIYRACYSNSNLIARVCASDTCKKTSLIDTGIDDMVVYGEENDDHEKIKREFQAILNGDTTTESHEFDSTLMQISDNIVISYSPATLYSTFIQFATLRSDITDKYNDLLNTLAYIDGFFSIDRESHELIPIEIKEYANNLNKTVLSRLKVFTEILKSLSNDQYNVMTAKLNNIIQTPKISYVFPKVVCPECGAEITEEPVDSMLNLLFTRAQLAQIKSL